MEYSDNTLAVLTALKQHTGWIALPELLAQLGPDFAERSVRRWLSQLIADGHIEKTGQKRATRYRAVARQLHKTTAQTPFLSTSNQEAIKAIQAPLFQRDPTAYQKHYLESYQPNLSHYLTKAQMNDLQTHGERKEKTAPAGTYARKIYDRLLIDLSYNSSRLEGNTYSLMDTEKLVLEGISNHDKLDAEKVMILNHKEAIRYLVDHLERISITPDTIKTLHYLLSDGLVPPAFSGQIRDHAVRISASTYAPLESPSQLESQLTLLCQKASQINNPYEQSFFLLVHLSYLQAFTDVNKRTSRLAANISLLKHNLVPLSFNDIDKTDYLNAMLVVYEKNNIGPLAELYCFSYLRTCQQYDVTVEAIGFDEMRVRFRTLRRNMIRHIILTKMTDEKLAGYIHTETAQQIPPNDQVVFIEQLRADLQQLTPGTLGGLGVTKDEFLAWQAIYKRF